MTCISIKTSITIRFLTFRLNFLNDVSSSKLTFSDFLKVDRFRSLFCLARFIESNFFLISSDTAIDISSSISSTLFCEFQSSSFMNLIVRVFFYSRFLRFRDVELSIRLSEFHDE